MIAVVKDNQESTDGRENKRVMEQDAKKEKKIVHYKSDLTSTPVGRTSEIEDKKSSFVPLEDHLML